MLQLGINLWVSLGSAASGGGVPDTTPIAPPLLFDLYWGSNTGITWGGDAIIDWPVID